MTALERRHILLPKWSGDGCPFLYLWFLARAAGADLSALEYVAYTRIQWASNVVIPACRLPGMCQAKAMHLGRGFFNRGATEGGTYVGRGGSLKGTSTRQNMDAPWQDLAQQVVAGVRNTAMLTQDAA